MLTAIHTNVSCYASPCRRCNRREGGRAGVGSHWYLRPHHRCALGDGYHHDAIVGVSCISLLMYVMECQTSLTLQSESQSAIMQFDNTDRAGNLRSTSPNQASGDTRGSIPGVISSVFGFAGVALATSR